MLPTEGEDVEQRRPGEHRQDDEEDHERDLKQGLAADSLSTRRAHGALLYPWRRVPLRGVCPVGPAVPVRSPPTDNRHDAILPPSSAVHIGKTTYFGICEIGDRQRPTTSFDVVGGQRGRAPVAPAMAGDVGDVSGGTDGTSLASPTMMADLGRLHSRHHYSVWQLRS